MKISHILAWLNPSVELYKIRKKDCLVFNNEPIHLRIRIVKDKVFVT